MGTPICAVAAAEQKDKHMFATLPCKDMYIPLLRRVLLLTLFLLPAPWRFSQIGVPPTALAAKRGNSSRTFRKNRQNRQEGCGAKRAQTMAQKADSSSTHAAELGAAAHEYDDYTMQ